MSLGKDVDNEQKKKRTMIFGIAVIMAILLFFWIVNIKSIMVPGPRIIKPAAETSNLSWDEIKNNFNSTMDDIGNKLTAISEKGAAEQAKEEANQKLQTMAADLSAQVETKDAISQLVASSSASASSSDLEAAAIKKHLQDLQAELERRNP